MTGYQELVERARADDDYARDVLRAAHSERDSTIVTLGPLAIAAQLQALRSQLNLRAYEAQL